MIKVKEGRKKSQLTREPSMEIKVILKKKQQVTHVTHKTAASYSNDSDESPINHLYRKGLNHLQTAGR
jgi:hypothetical protein